MSEVLGRADCSRFFASAMWMSGDSPAGTKTFIVLLVVFGLPGLVLDSSRALLVMASGVMRLDGWAVVVVAVAFGDDGVGTRGVNLMRSLPVDSFRASSARLVGPIGWRTGKIGVFDFLTGSSTCSVFFF